MGRSLSIDQLLERWRSLEDQGATMTLEELCDGQREEIDDVKEKLRAVASMMSFLGLMPEPATVGGRGPVGTASTKEEVIRHLARGGLGEVVVALENDVEPTRSVATPGAGGPDGLA